MGIIGFLFGKAPKITFTREGRTAHELDAKKWEAWKDRFAKSPEYDYRHHAGTQGAKSKATNLAETPKEAITSGSASSSNASAKAETKK